ncbi:MAG: hypothetical protein K6E53_01395 [Lachnospiraceae bacterium]|nr:hypothetical protein [Lachnospiraceae bacterium]
MNREIVRDTLKANHERCVGMAKVTEQSVLKDVIEEADAQLYVQKRR